MSKFKRDHPKLLKIFIIAASLIVSSIASQVVMAMFFIFLNVPYLKELSNIVNKGILFTGIVFAFVVFIVSFKYSYKYFGAILDN